MEFSGESISEEDYKKKLRYLNDGLLLDPIAVPPKYQNLLAKMKYLHFSSQHFYSRSSSLREGICPGPPIPAYPLY